MPLDAILEVAIGLVFTWLVLSVAVMEIQNWISARLEMRARFLEASILEMFSNQQSLVDQFYAHPAIVALSRLDKKGRLKRPASIPSVVFAETAIEVLLNAGKFGQEVPVGSMSYDRMASSIEETKSTHPDLSRLMDHLFPQSLHKGGKSLPQGMDDFVVRLVVYRANVEKWFDNAMEKASGVYKDNALAWAFGIGLALAVVFNIDTVNITRKLWQEPTIRQALVAQADTYVLEDGIQNIAQAPGYFDSLALPIGWTTVPAPDPSACFSHLSPDGKFFFRTGGECRLLVNVPVATDMIGWLVKLMGFVISAFATRQGAPFWYDLLKKLLGMRNTVKEEQAKG